MTYRDSWKEAYRPGQAVQIKWDGNWRDATVHPHYQYIPGRGVTVLYNGIPIPISNKDEIRPKPI